MVLFLVTFEAKLWICWTRFPSVLKFRTHHFVLQALQFCSIGLLLLKKLLRPVWWFWRGAWRRITCTATPIQPAKRTAFQCMMIATFLRWMIHLALVVWFKPFSSSGFRMRTVLCHQDRKKMRTQQTIDVNRLKIERTKHTSGNGRLQNKNWILHKPHDLELPTHLYSDSQLWVRKRLFGFSASHTHLFS